MKNHIAFYFLLGVCAARAEEPSKFDFGPGPVSPGYTQVTKASVYDPQKGYGFVESGEIQDVSRPGSDALHNDFCTSAQPFTFAVDLPEGDYNVTVTLGDSADQSETTVKAESRELMLENVKTTRGEFQSRTFTVNVRTPKLPDGKAVGLSKRESGPPVAAHWDNRLSLEFSGKRPCVDALEITPHPGLSPSSSRVTPPSRSNRENHGPAGGKCCHDFSAPVSPLPITPSRAWPSLALRASGASIKSSAA